MNRTLLAIFAMALLTYFIRMIPITFLRKHIQSKRIRSFLYYIPFTVLGAMTFPAIFTSTATTISGVSGCVVALVLAYFERSLLSVTLISVLVVYVTEAILKFI